MKNSTFFIKLTLVVIAVLIGIMYIKPTLDSISEVQDDILTYQNEINNVGQVNARLASLVSQIDSVSNTDQQALLRYLPNQIDELVVLQDIQSIISRHNFIIQDVSYDENISNNEEIDGVVVHQFSFSGSTNYAELKALLATFAQNDYLLEFQKLEVTAAAGDTLDVTAELVAYTRTTDN